MIKNTSSYGILRDSLGVCPWHVTRQASGALPAIQAFEYQTVEWQLVVLHGYSLRKQEPPVVYDRFIFFALDLSEGLAYNTR